MNKPLKPKRSVANHIVRTALVACTLAILGGLAYGAYTVMNPPQLPSYVAQPGYSSSTYVEVIRDSEIDITSFITASATDGVVQVSYDGDSRGLVDWVGDDSHWFQLRGDRTPIRYENSAQDDADLGVLLSIGDGLTIDEVLPPVMRRYVQVEDVSKATILGRDVQRFDTYVEVGKMARNNQAALAAFQTFWEDDGFDELPPVNGVTNVSIWVDDTGMIYKVESAASGSDLYSLTFSGVANDNSLAPTMPTDFVEDE